ncbi:hypothetical protein PENTCL1PPCAC_11089 [Pristionchus entomophagus]|uniref:Ribosomal protein n=1 Tax=Pristionchus entomophagus TaxID=358040 RepID=A0AAV5T8J9_9BILA|nr:hypothetical protein PENTCL1PPCAC_11089 [Pristionchus entomophagus]
MVAFSSDEILAYGICSFSWLFVSTPFSSSSLTIGVNRGVISQSSSVSSIDEVGAPLESFEVSFLYPFFTLPPRLSSLNLPFSSFRYLISRFFIARKIWKAQVVSFRLTFFLAISTSRMANFPPSSAIFSSRDSFDFPSSTSFLELRKVKSTGLPNWKVRVDGAVKGTLKMDQPSLVEPNVGAAVGVEPKMLFCWGALEPKRPVEQWAVVDPNRPQLSIAPGPGPFLPAK